MVCLACGGTRFKALRLGVSRARGELSALAGEAVVEVTASTAPDDPAVSGARLLIGTEALLHRVAQADAVAFLDFDQELLAPLYRAGEQALALLARAARVVARTATAPTDGCSCRPGPRTTRPWLPRLGPTPDGWWRGAGPPASARPAAEPGARPGVRRGCRRRSWPRSERRRAWR
ncbi:MAG: hypothetical protein R2746_11525 [Acidimicrobiales bacterium]